MSDKSVKGIIKALYFPVRAYINSTINNCANLYTVFIQQFTPFNRSANPVAIVSIKDFNHGRYAFQ